MKTFVTGVLAATCLSIMACGGQSNKKASEPGANAAPAPVDSKNPEPASQGFMFVDSSELELPLYVRGQMNGWLGENVTAEMLAASRLNFNKDSGCYMGTLNLDAGDTLFRLASYLPEAAGAGWSHLKVGLGDSGSTHLVQLGQETNVAVYYFPAGDANGKDLGGGGNLMVNFPAKAAYEFKLCTRAEDYTKAYLTISAL